MKSRLSIRLGKEDVLTDFERALVIGSRKADPIQPSRVWSEKISSEQQFTGLLIIEVIKIKTSYNQGMQSSTSFLEADGLQWQKPTCSATPVR